MNKEEIELKISVIISATNTSGNDKLAAIMELITPPPQTVSAREFYKRKISELHTGIAVVLLKGELITAEQAAIWAEEYRTQPVKFTPERTVQDEADRLVWLHYDNCTTITKHEAILGAIIDITNTITALKAANVSTVWHEEVLTILKGM